MAITMDKLIFLCQGHSNVTTLLSNDLYGLFGYRDRSMPSMPTCLWCSRDVLIAMALQIFKSSSRRCNSLTLYDSIDKSVCLHAVHVQLD